MIPTWILTFNRPVALNRLIRHLGEQGVRINVFSNHPAVMIADDLRQYVDEVVINSLNSDESNSWCARSWNTIMMKGFPKSDRLILLQDDTDIGPGFAAWIAEQAERYDFIWGPKGDQFHYLTLDVLRRARWWDERFIGCYCGDADFLKRVYFSYPKDRMSIVEEHCFGFVHNDCGVREHILINEEHRFIDPDYKNQHWEFEERGLTTIAASEQHYREKWRANLPDHVPCIASAIQYVGDIDWYPWFTKKYLS